jgi:hypothetical protein
MHDMHYKKRNAHRISENVHHTTFMQGKASVAMLTPPNLRTLHLNCGHCGLL